jgi:hypothetical protein
MSIQPSFSKSKKAQPAPVVSGRNFSSDFPSEWAQWMPLLSPGICSNGQRAVSGKASPRQFGKASDPARHPGEEITAAQNLHFVRNLELLVIIFLVRTLKINEKTASLGLFVGSRRVGSGGEAAVKRKFLLRFFLLASADKSCAKRVVNRRISGGEALGDA